MDVYAEAYGGSLGEGMSQVVFNAAGQGVIATPEAIANRVTSSPNEPVPPLSVVVKPPPEVRPAHLSPQCIQPTSKN